MAYISSAQAAAILGVSPRTLEKWRRSGKSPLPFIYTYWPEPAGGGIPSIKGALYEEADVMEFLVNPPAIHRHRIGALLRTIDPSIKQGEEATC